jgi:hypothetical protein
VSLPFRRPAQWRWRWLVTREGELLHRVAAYERLDRRGPMIARGARTVCGVRGDLAMPGLGSRLGGSRCRRCCRGVSIAHGWGAPYNAGMRDR